MGTASSLGSGRCGDQQPRTSLGCRSDFHHTERSQLLLHPTGSGDSWERSRPQHRPPGPRLPAPRGREPAWRAQLCSWGRLLCGSALLSPSSVARGIAMTEKSTVGGGPGAPTPPADVVNCGAVQHPGSGAGGPLGWDPSSATLPSNSSTLGHPEKRHWGGCAAGRGKDDESQERMLGAAGTRKDSAQPMMLINDSLINKGLHARVMGLCQSCGEGSSAGRARWHRALEEGGPPAWHLPFPDAHRIWCSLPRQSHTSCHWLRANGGPAPSHHCSSVGAQYLPSAWIPVGFPVPWGHAVLGWHRWASETADFVSQPR